MGEKVQEEQEYQAFVDHAYEDKALRDMKNVFVTDHTPRPKRLHTNNSDEDLDFFNYEQKLKEFHSDSPAVLHSTQEKFVHPIIKILEKAEYLTAEKYEAGEFDEAEGDVEIEPEELFSISNSLVPEEEIQDVIDNQIGIVKEGEEYSYVEDMRDAYRNSLSQSLADQIFEKIPNHAFYDIKTPLIERAYKKYNKYNPARPAHAYSFFEHRKSAEYIDEKHKYSNLNTSISKHKRY